MKQILICMDKELIIITNYDELYPKLFELEFTTIRRYQGNRKIHNIDPQYLRNNFLFNAKIYFIEYKTLEEIPDYLLLKDTNCKDRIEAYILFNKFYKKQINFRQEKLCIFYLKKIVDSESEFYTKLKLKYYKKNLEEIEIW